MIEIERKFLVNSLEFKKKSYQKTHIKQGFLNSHKERTVRVRVNGDRAYLTIKGVSNKSGTTRFEWEKEITTNEALVLIDFCEVGIIEKYRYLVNYKNQTFEVDEFIGINKGLIIAEIELSNEDEKIEKPLWLGKEVTGQTKYYNSILSKKPYSKW